MVGGILGGTWGVAAQADSFHSVNADLQTHKVEMLLPPGAGAQEVRGSLTVERFPVTERQLPDGSSTRTLPVVFTFVNHWVETFIFDAYNEAVLTDLAGNQLFPASVVRNNQRVQPGVSGLIPSGYTVEFTLFYDLDEAYSDANLD